VLLAIKGSQIFAMIWRNSIRLDEIGMITSAYYHFADAYYQLVNEPPALREFLLFSSKSDRYDVAGNPNPNTIVAA